MSVLLALASAPVYTENIMSSTQHSPYETLLFGHVW